MRLLVVISLTLTVCSLKSQWTPVNFEPGLFGPYFIRNMNMDGSVIFCSGTSGISQGIFYSNDGGENFKYYADLTSAWGTIYYLRFLKGGTLLIVTSKGILKQSPNKSDLPEFIIEFATDSLYPNGYSALTIFWGDSGIVNSKFSYKTYDGGNTWQKMNDSPHKYYLGTRLEYIPSSGRMIVANGLHIYVSEDFGDTWEILYDFYKVTNNTNKLIRDISFINDSIGFFSANKDIYKTTDGGKNWQPYSKNYEVSDLLSIKFFDNLTAYSIGTDKEYIYKTTDGKNWIREFKMPSFSGYQEKMYYFNDSMFFVPNQSILYKSDRLSLGIKPPGNNSLGIEINIYPNPATGYITINLPESITEFSYELFDLQGRLIFAGMEENNKTAVFLANLQPGLYVLNVRANGYAIQQKIIKTTEY